MLDHTFINNIIGADFIYNSVKKMKSFYTIIYKINYSCCCPNSIPFCVHLKT